MGEKIIKFPEGDDWFAYRAPNGELQRLYKGRYAIIKTPDGKYHDVYISPDMGQWEDLVLETGDQILGGQTGNSEVIEKRQINSRKDYKELLKKVAELNDKERD
ncbi:MAG: hypothetical protein UX31_C0001G0055 [Candidatus Nomurabacteria bacterium GW2011_GWA1_46_11]|uniref:Uncharacterized protein n=2 Tax=Parcubacteria group TaxID=1794811 RepID=A0A1F8EZ04_9BACT|nr:MAG: hypothetical protein UX31_C0001G0055 [Candidatus Nomurabacteria bacterium GW2011_GWA1_46_11]OGN06083.1 MAG: hypothetical protein A2669_00960 [Candidatus Yanofskybacteria bacterium RIFCSPHIGHO2_01_FULL_48_25b]